MQTEENDNNRRAWDKTDTLVIKVRNGDLGATKELVEQYKLLVYKISHRIWARYNKSIELQSIIDYAKYLIIYLTLMEYDPSGVARFPHFLKTHLHARLVQQFRPIAVFTFRSTPLSEAQDVPYANGRAPSDELQDKEHKDIYLKIIWFMDNTFTEREKEVILEHVIKGVPRSDLAKKYGISNAYLQIVQDKCLAKLRKYLLSIGYGIMKGDR